MIKPLSQVLGMEYKHFRVTMPAEVYEVKKYGYNKALSDLDKRKVDVDKLGKVLFSFNCPEFDEDLWEEFKISYLLESQHIIDHMAEWITKEEG